MISLLLDFLWSEVFMTLRVYLVKNVAAPFMELLVLKGLLLTSEDVIGTWRANIV